MKNLISMHLTQDDDQYWLTADADSPIMNLDCWPTRIGTGNELSMTACIDAFLDICERQGVDPTVFNWAPFRRTENQIVRASELHQRVEDITAAILEMNAIDPVNGFAYFADEDEVVEFCEAHHISLGTATPADILNWQNIQDDFVEARR